MALTSKKHEAIHGKTGDDLAAIKASFDNGEHTPLTDFGPEAAIIYQMQKMQDEIDYLRTEISSNKNKATNVSTNLSATANGTSLSINSSDGTNVSVPAATTSAWGIMTDDHATAIAANTAKVSFAGGSATTLSFGELITTSGGKGQPSTYTIVLTATKSGVTKTVTLTLT
tara:strand:- start:56 stop:568 length:513 start_codon:yes stop_codon:yes gene_type:complete